MVFVGNINQSVDVANGFEEKMDVFVMENGGKNRGEAAHFIVTYTFEPLEK